MTSNSNAQEAFVWIWLPNKVTPVVAGRLVKSKEQHYFHYGKEYLKRPDAISLSPLELPLRQEMFGVKGLNTIPSCIRDSGPDAWGRRLIDYQYPTLAADELDYLLLSGSDRIGGLDFQTSSKDYDPRKTNEIQLDELLKATDCIEKGQQLPQKWSFLFLRGTSIGGARPKALIQIDNKKYIAKFPLSSDLYNIIKAEYVTMRLADLLGLSVAKVKLTKVTRKDVLLVERFDRQISCGDIYSRRLMLSALTLLGLSEMEARYASYKDFSDIIRKHFVDPKQTLIELYKRLLFNVLTGNTDDHARNHAAFWDGTALTLTPAYDLCPQLRAGQETSQAMAIEGKFGNLSTLQNVISVCDDFQIQRERAKALAYDMVEEIKRHWPLLCDEAQLTKLDQKQLWQRAILNPFCFVEK